jgi:hypothetical protein
MPAQLVSYSLLQTCCTTGCSADGRLAMICWQACLAFALAAAGSVAASEHACSSVFFAAVGIGTLWYAALHSATAAAPPPAGAPPLAAGLEVAALVVVVEAAVAETEEDTADWIEDASDAAVDSADDTWDDTEFEIELALGVEPPHPAIRAALAIRAVNESFLVTRRKVERRDWLVSVSSVSHR